MSSTVQIVLYNQPRVAGAGRTEKGAQTGQQPQIGDRLGDDPQHEQSNHSSGENRQVPALALQEPFESHVDAHVPLPI